MFSSLMQSKALLIAIAAFAVTTTGVHAYGGQKIFSRAGLSPQQIEAFEVARDLQQQGDSDRARDVLVAAGVNEETLSALQRVMRQTRHGIHAALTANDFAAFREIVIDSPLADLITTEADFQQFRLAHELRRSGAWEKSDAIFTALGVEKVKQHRQHRAYQKNQRRQQIASLTPEQHDALRVAQQANNRTLTRAILEDAGLDGWISSKR